MEHFCSCAAVTVSVYFGCLYLNRLARYRFVLSGGCSVIVGVLKEIGDYLKWWPGLLSLRDLAADLVGTVVALTVLVAAESTWGRPLTHRPGGASGA